MALATTAQGLHRGAEIMNLMLPGAGGPSDGPDMVPVAFVARVSDEQVQDPTLSIPRQLSEVRAKLPPGWTIVAYYWDIESGGKELDQRGLGRAHEKFDVPVPRDGGMWDLRREAAKPDRVFAAVMCSSIERTARESVDSQWLERELWKLGVPLLAADEPQAFDRKNPNSVLLRRIKQGVGEWFRLNLLHDSWGGMRTHAEQGWHTGPVPYGYAAERVPHPVPAKRAEGKTKAKLLPDPERAHVVPLIYRWRVEEGLAYEAIRTRLNSDLSAYPPPADTRNRQRAGWWAIETIKHILSNPKYTGYMVWNRGDKRGRAKPPSEWVWSLEPSHPALVTRELWERAAEVGRETERSRAGDGLNSHPQTQRTYRLRSHVTCSICGRRMAGRNRRGVASYRCKTTHRDPRTAKRFPDHPSEIEVRERPIMGAIETFFAEHVFGPNRLELFREHFDDSGERARAEYERRLSGLEGRIAAAEQDKKRLVREMANLPDDEEIAAELRAGLQAEFAERERERRGLVAELEALRATEPQMPEDTALLAELPTLPGTLAGVDEAGQREMFRTFGLAVQYDRRRQVVELCVTLTDRLVEIAREVQHGPHLWPCPPPTGGGGLESPNGGFLFFLIGRPSLPARWTAGPPSRGSAGRRRRSRC
jgi:site-specific DNA recombinase